MSDYICWSWLLRLKLCSSPGIVMFWALQTKPIGMFCVTTLTTPGSTGLYGDEATIFDGLSYMCIAWSSENSPFASFSSCSRFLICLLPVPLYLMSLVPNDRKRKINETLQAAIGCIVESLDSWSSSPVCGLRGESVALKGEWLTQVLCLRHHAGTNQVCWQCPASKSIEFACTDLSSGGVETIKT